ncbi:XF1762 family protein [Nonomuraea sp. NPDC004297]
MHPVGRLFAHRTWHRLVPSTARAFTAWTHCHLKAPAQAEIVLGAYAGDGTLVGVVFAGACEHGDVSTAEVICLSTDGTPNACTALLSAVGRAVGAAGYRRLVTRIGPDKSSPGLPVADFCPVAQHIGDCLAVGRIRGAGTASGGMS